MEGNTSVKKSNSHKFDFNSLNISFEENVRNTNFKATNMIYFTQNLSIKHLDY